MTPEDINRTRMVMKPNIDYWNDALFQPEPENDWADVDRKYRLPNDEQIELLAAAMGDTKRAFDRWLNGPSVDDLYWQAFANVQMDALTVMHRFEQRATGVRCPDCADLSLPVGDGYCPTVGEGYDATEH